MQPGDMQRGYLYDLTFNENGVSRRVHVKYLRPVNMSQSKETYQPGHRFQLVNETGEDYRMMFDEESNIIEDLNYDNLRGMLRERFRESDNTFMIGDDQFEDEEFKILPNVLVENEEQIKEMFAAYNLKLGHAPKGMFTKRAKGKKSRKSRKSRKSKKSRKSRK
jgi:hypothetical protein